MIQVASFLSSKSAEMKLFDNYHVTVFELRIAKDMHVISTSISYGDLEA